MRIKQLTVMVIMLLVFTSLASGQSRGGNLPGCSIKENLQEFCGEGFNMIKAWRPKALAGSKIFQKISTSNLFDSEGWFKEMAGEFFLEADEIIKTPLIMWFSATTDTTGVISRLCGYPGGKELLEEFREGYSHYGIEEEKVNGYQLISVLKSGSSEPVPAICIHDNIIDQGDEEALVAHYQSEDKKGSEMSILCKESLTMMGKEVMTLNFLEGDSDWARADLFSLLNPSDRSMDIFRAAEGIRGFCSQSWWGDELLIRKHYFLAKGVNGQALVDHCLKNQDVIIEKLLGDLLGSRKVAEKCLAVCKGKLTASTKDGGFTIMISVY